MTRLALLVVVASLALVPAGCMGDGGSDASSTAEWADSFCTAVNDWTAELERVGGEVTSSPSVESLQQGSEELGEATDTLVDEIRDLGAPDTEAGDEVEEAVSTFADAAEDEKAKVEEAVEEAEGEGTTGLAAALGVVGGSLQTMTAAYQTMLQAFEDADVANELDTAFSESEACQQLGES